MFSKQLTFILTFSDCGHACAKRIATTSEVGEIDNQSPFDGRQIDLH
jgi:hypothetical protein